MHARKEQIKTLGRLKKRSDFLYVQHSGQKWVAKGLVLQVLKREEGEFCRFGVVASKKLSRSAVVRNRVKRRLRSAVSNVYANYKLPVLDLVLIGRRETETRSLADLEKDVIWCLKKLGHINPA